MHARSGRLHRALRGQFSLIYSVSALVQQGFEGGMSGAYVRASIDVQKRVLRLAVQETRRLLIEGVDEPELEKCKQIALLGFVESLSSSRTLVRWIGLFHRLKRVRFLETYRKEIESVTVATLDSAIAELARHPIVTLTAESTTPNQHC